MQADPLPHTTIDELAAHVGSGATPRGGSEVYRTDGVLFVRSQNVRFDGLHLDDVAYIDPRTHRAMSRTEVFPADVLLNITGASIGRCCVLPDGLGPTNVNQHVCAIRLPQPNPLDAAFLSAVLASHIGQAQVDRLNAGGNREGLNYAQVRAFRLPWPPAEVRRRIATILGTLDDAIRRTEQVIAKLRQMKRGLLHDLLTRGVDDNGDPRDPARTPEAFADTELGVVPRHWEVGGFSMFRCPDRQLIKTGPFGTAMTGRRWADTGVPVITIGSLGERELIRENLLFLAANDAKAFSSYELREGDVVFSRVADVGRSLVIRAAQAGWIMSSNLMRISLDNARVVPDYVHLAIVYADSSRRQVRRLANAGAREVVNTAILTQLRFGWPPRAEQSRICRVVEAHDAEVAGRLRVLEKLRLLKHGLLHDLLTGRVRVPLPPEVTP